MENNKCCTSVPMTEHAVKLNCNVPALWIEHKEMLANYIRKRIKDEDSVNDILQEVLMKIYNFCMSRSGVKNLRSWLFQIAHNTIIDHLRKNSRFVAAEEDFDMEAEASEETYREAAEFILPMINLLPEEYAVPLRMSDVEDIKQDIIAEKLNLGLSATKSRIQRARKMLKDIIIEYAVTETDSKGRLLSFDIKPGKLEDIKGR